MHPYRTMYSIHRDLEYSPEMSRRPILVLIPGHWIEAGVLYFNSPGNRPNAVSSANVQGSAGAVILQATG